jgi:hypothetical protein
MKRRPEADSQRKGKEGGKKEGIRYKKTEQWMKN